MINRRISICLFALLAFAGSATAQIHFRLLEPTRSDWYYFLSAFDGKGQNYIAAGLYQLQVAPYTLIAILRTTDAGKTWLERKVDVKRNMNFSQVKGVTLVDSLHAFVWADSNIILRTRDGCQTWEQIRSPAKLIFSMSFADSLHGMAIGNWYPNLILRTSDGGDTWDTIVFPTPGAVWYSKAIAQNHYALFAKDKGPYYETKDNFATIDSFNVDFPGIAYANLYDFVTSGDTIIAFGNQAPQGYGLAVRSVDHGKTWAEIVEARRVHFAVGCVSDLKASVVFFGGLYTDNILVYTNGSAASAHYTFHPVTFDTAFYPSWVVGMTLTPDGHILGVMNYMPYEDSYGALVYGDFGTASVPFESDSSVLLYPNPASSVLHLKGFDSHVVFDALGRAYTVPNHEGTLDISTLPAGVYYISDGTQRARFVKE